MSSEEPSEDYDIVLLNGRVMDPETHFDAVANVGIKGDRIVKITKQEIQGTTIIDVTGMVVAPGFIDTHSHWVLPVGAKLAARDGRTTLMDLEFGVNGRVADHWYTSTEGTLEVNFGKGSSHEAARREVLDQIYVESGSIQEDLEGRKANNWATKKPSLEEGNQIMDIVDQGLQAGCVGVSSTLGYMRSGTSCREVFELQKLGAAYNRPAAMHFRGTPGDEVGEVTGIQELLANAAALGAPAIACHFNNPGYNLVHELIHRMQQRGMNVWGELYPYNAGSTTINAVYLVPEVWCDALGHKYEDTMQDALTGEFYTLEKYRETVKNDPVRLVILFKMPQECIVDWLRFPGVAIASDTMPIFGPTVKWETPFEELPNGHPRAAGCCACALRMAREAGIPLMHTITQLSYTSAKHLGMCGLKSMKERGRVQEGMIADLAIFDPINVTDKATYMKGCLPSEGIPYVLVSGVFVVKDSKSTTAKPGKPIRFEKVVPSRREPLNELAWKRAWTVGFPKLDFGGTDHKHESVCGC